MSGHQTAERQVRTPGPDHPISIEPNPNRLVVTVAGQVVADTQDALTLREASYPPVHYVPRQDVRMASLTRTDHTTHCPYKGDASYLSVPAGGQKAANAVWTYEAPHPSVVAIRDHVAFYADRVDSIEERPAD